MGFKRWLIARQLPGGLLVTCSYCGKIRDVDGEWKMDDGLRGMFQKTGKLSHGICLECRERLIGGLRNKDE